MKLLILMLGAPASGKSTWVKNNKLEDYTISPDNLRLLHQSPKLNIEGKVGISQSNDGEVWALVHTLIGKRMQKGELIVVDATNSSNKMLNAYRDKVKKYRYRVVAIDFRSIPLEVVLRQNREREEVKFVPEDAIERIHSRLQVLNIPSWINVLPNTTSFDDINSMFIDFNMDSFDGINVFGDIHGAYKNIKEAYNKLNPQGSNFMNIFVGDYLDRYPNEEALKDTLLFLNSLKRENNLFLVGNHEDKLVHLRTFLKVRNTDEYPIVRKLIPSKSTRKTLHTICELGLEDELKSFVARIGQIATFNFKDKFFSINHGGLPIYPNIKVAAEEYIKGVGGYGDEVDIISAFSSNTPKTHYQIFGHRDITNVEDKLWKEFRGAIVNGDAEFGGEYKYLQLTCKDGEINMEYFKDTSYYPKVERPKVQPTQLQKETIVEDLKAHRGVKVNYLGNGVVSANFINQVFRKGKFDNFTTLARGLFLREKDGKVIARGYEKFFNINEQRSTNLNSLKQLNYPLKMSHKPNGYLGILSAFVNEDGRLTPWISSKSTNKGAYADKFRELILPHITDEVLRFMVDKNVTFTFEVIEPRFDPHIVEYKEPQLIVLNAIVNDIEFQVLYQPKILSNLFPKLEINKVEKTIHNYNELLEVIAETEQAENLSNYNIEGYVFQEAVTKQPFMFKLKTKWYKFWKYHRTNLEKLNRAIDKTKKDWTTIEIELKVKAHTNDDLKIILFMLEQVKKGVRYSDVITLRNDYLKSLGE